jgi:hypothetical protein
MTNKDIERVVEEFDEMPFGITLPFNQDMMWGEKVGFEADGREELKTWLRTALTAMYEQGVRDAMAGVPEEMENTKGESNSDWFYGYGHNTAVRTMREHCQSLLKADK